MKFSIVAVASLFASVAYSQTIASEVAQIPSCALTCLTTAITGAGCGLSDYACQCGTAKDSITTSATPCVLSKCATSDALKVQSITSEICTIQAASGGGSSSAGSSASAATTSPAATTKAAPTPTTSNVSNISNISNIGNFATSATSAAGGVTTSAAASSASTSAPAQVSGSPGNRLQAGGVLAGAAAFVALVL